jgi:hypothetical protein
MNIGLDSEQDLNILVQQRESEYTPKEDSHSKIPGARINPSKIEPLSEIFSKYQEDIPLTEILKEEPLNENAVEKNAKSAVYGTLVHNLKYFTGIFQATDRLGRIPNRKDLESVFINKKDDYYSALLKIMDETINQGLTKDPVLNAHIFWEIWRRNGQNYTPEKHKNFLISPDKIKYMYENHTIPDNDIEQFIANHKSQSQENIPFTAYETFLLLNLYFPNCNLQVPTYIDKIEIDKNTDKPIKIVDYKTGKQFKEPEFREKVQIFLMTLAVFTNLIDKTSDIDYSVSDWDIVHSQNNIPLPRFKENSKVIRKGLLGSIQSEYIVDLADIIRNSIEFSYVNPVTMEEIKINLEDIFKNISSTSKYLNRLTEFYIRNKKILKTKLSGRNTPYALPQFPKKGFLEDNYQTEAVQLSLNV